MQISLEIAKKIKSVAPPQLIVFGGPQVPKNAEAFLRQNPYIDVVVHGEGEKIFLDIVETFPERDFKGIASVSFIDENGIFINHPAKSRTIHISEFPSPYMEGIFAPLMAANPEENWIALWETNRGCPFGCAYCDWGSSVQTKVLTFDMERIDAELSWFSKNKINYVFCCDANFGILPRDIEIAKLVAKYKKSSGYPRNIGIQNTKNMSDRAYEAQKIFMDAALTHGATIALQSLNNDTIKMIKRQNISLKAFQELQERFNRDGIVTYTDIILGLPGETFESFTDGISKVIEGGQHNRIILSLLSILPNADMGDPEYQDKYGLSAVKSRIVNTHGVVDDYDDEIFEIQKLVVGTAAMPKNDWQEAYRFGWMTNLLYFTKLLQIPFLIIHKQVGIRIKDMIIHFINADKRFYPLLSEVSNFLLKRAQDIQNGEPENIYKKEWLGIYWPDDEYLLIKLCVEDKLEQFHKESKEIIASFLFNKIPSNLLDDAIRLNRFMLKQPFQGNDVRLDLDYDILSYWRSIKKGTDFSLENEPISYLINRKEQVWGSWEDWMREVVWYRNRSGAYLYEDIIKIN